MKGVIVELDSKYAVALNKEGRFLKVKNNGQYKVGYEVDIPTGVLTNKGWIAKATSIAAIFLFSVGISYGAYSYNIPYSYIDVDINPSIEITTNVFDRIIKVEALNNDGMKLLEKVNYKNRDIKSGIEGILQSAAEEGYIKSDADNAVMFTVASNDNKKVSKIEEKIRKEVSEKLKTGKMKTDVYIEAVPLEKHDSALKEGISPGKQLLIQKLLNNNPELKAEDYKNTPVKEIIKAIKEAENKKVKPDNEKTDIVQENKEKDNQKKDKDYKQDKTYQSTNVGIEKQKEEIAKKRQEKKTEETKLGKQKNQEKKKEETEKEEKKQEERKQEEKKKAEQEVTTESSAKSKGSDENGNTEEVNDKKSSTEDGKKGKPENKKGKK